VTDTTIASDWRCDALEPRDDPNGHRCETLASRIAKLIGYASGISTPRASGSWQTGRLGIDPFRDHLGGMSNGTQITVHFSCPCGMHYTATQEHRPEQSSGSFKCQECRKPVHEWRGDFHYFDWQATFMKPMRPGAGRV
jgi:hypothetical protein